MRTIKSTDLQNEQEVLNITPRSFLRGIIFRGKQN